MESVSWLDPLKAQVFATTRWSVVKACTDTTERRAREALGELCQAYWLPVYACIRHQGYSPHDAEDLTQDFFIQLLNGRYLELLDQTKGRFRAYLLAALKNFLRDRWRRRWTWRRGRGVVIVSLKVEAAENGGMFLPPAAMTPESVYERQWVRTVIEQVLEQLRLEMSAGRHAIPFDHLEDMLAGEFSEFSYAEAAKSLNMTTGALHTAVHRCRKRFRVLMQEEIGRTLLTKSEIETELKYLLSVFTNERIFRRSTYDVSDSDPFS